jgi:hypothetical protein
MREKLNEVTESLGHGGASRRAANAIIKLLDNKEPINPIK